MYNNDSVTNWVSNINHMMWDFQHNLHAETTNSCVKLYIMGSLLIVR